MSKIMPKRACLYDNGKGHKWWEQPTEMNRKDPDATEYLLSSPTLEHAQEMRTLLGKLSITSLAINEGIKNKAKIKNLLATIEAEEREVQE